MEQDTSLGKPLIVFLSSIVSASQIAEKKGVIGGHYYIAKPMQVEGIIAFLTKHLSKQSRNNTVAATALQPTKRNQPS